jgi:hypothetical protein
VSAAGAQVGVLRALLAALLLAATAAAGQNVPLPPEVLVRWAPGAPRTAASIESAVGRPLRIEPLIPRRAAGRRIAVAHVERWSLVRIDPPVDVEALVERLRRWPGVDEVQANGLSRFADFRTDDPRLDDQWNLDLIGWRDRDPGSAAGVLVAIVDSGVDADHPDLAPALWRNGAEAAGAAGVDDDGNGYVDDVAGWDFTDAPGLPGDGDYLDRDADPDDESGHGTHVAGIVGAVGDNGVGVAGVAPGVTLMPLRAGFNIGGSGYLQDDDIAAAIVYAADNGADIINLSLGDPRFSPVLADAVAYAAALDVVIVAAAGNEGSTEVYFPARLDETICVGAAGRAGGRVSFSNVGPSVDLLAPGLAILSTRPGGTWGESSGTSMAAPHVAGAAALLRARHPEYTRWQVAAALTASAGAVWTPTAGFGLLRLERPTSMPLAAVITQPLTGRVSTADTVQVRVWIEAPSGAAWELAWGPGEVPSSWEIVSTGEAPPPGEEIAVAWVPPAGTGALSLRLRVRAPEGEHADRVVIQRLGDGPMLSDVRVSRALRGARWESVVDWHSDPAAPGAVELVDGDEVVLRVLSGDGRAEHTVVLPEDLPAGTYDVRVVSGGRHAEAAERLHVGPGGVQRWDLDVDEELAADGYLLPRFTDFDGDGTGEVVAMVSGAGVYGETRIWEADSEAPAHVSSQLYLPWEAGDLDGDGRADLLGVDAQRVRLFEATEESPWPRRVAWEATGVWGGETADLDGDGRPEAILRSATGAQFRVFESVGDDAFVETAAFVNATPGENEMGDRQSVGDLDGDGRTDWVAGDSDGDLIAYESVGDDAYRPVWADAVDEADIDGRLLGPAADLDGDGALEFVSGRLHRDPFDVETRRWRLTVYGVDDGGPVAEWSVEVVAGASSGNGVAVADVDGDGDLEWIAVTVPQLYVFDHVEEGGYRPVWHRTVGTTQRPATGDLDGDGRQEVAFNEVDGALRLLRWKEPAIDLLAPGDLRAVPLDAQRVALAWDAVDGASAYEVRRDREPAAVLSSALSSVPSSQARRITWVDSGVVAGRAYVYDLAAVDSAGATGHRSPEVSVIPSAPPVVERVRRVGAQQLAVHFDRPMSATAVDAFRYRLEPPVAESEAAILDRGGARVLVSFDRPLPDATEVLLHLDGVRATTGASLAGGAVIVPPGSVHALPRLLSARALDETSIRLDFDGPVDVGGATVTIGDGAVQVAEVDAGDSTGVVTLRLDGSTPLEPLGRTYDVDLTGLRDTRGRSFDARARVRLDVTELTRLRLFPNPLDPTRHDLTIAGLPLGATVTVYTVAGERVWSGEEADGDGGLQWDGRNDAGVAVAPGIYLLVAEHEGRRRRHRVALLPQP